MSVEAEDLAKALVEALRANDSGAWIGTHSQDTDDLTNLTIDGTFNLVRVCTDLCNRRAVQMSPSQDPSR